MRASTVIRPFRVIVFHEGDVMCAQVLEHDMAVHGRDLDEISARLQRIMMTHVLACEAEGRKPFADTHRAPEKYWNWFRAGDKLPTLKWQLLDESQLPAAPAARVEIPQPEIRFAAAVNE